MYGDEVKLQRRLQTACAPAGFSFVEILFAVMILGIGLILIAALFPVSIRQAATAADETTAATVAWNAMNVIRETLTDDELTPGGTSGQSGVVRSFRDPQAKGLPSLRAPPSGRPQGQPVDWIWRRVSSEMVYGPDRRFAWIGFYRRDISNNWAPYAQLIVIVARSPEGRAFDSNDVTGAPFATLQPRPVTFNLTSDGAGSKVDQIVEFSAGAKDMAAPGSFLVIAHDKSRGSPDEVVPGDFLSGRVYRIGNRLEGDRWELAPESVYRPQQFTGHERPAPAGSSGAEGFIIGRSSDGDEAMDLAAFSMFIAVRPNARSR